MEAKIETYFSFNIDGKQAESKLLQPYWKECFRAKKISAASSGDFLRWTQHQMHAEMQLKPERWHW